ncbi:MAG: 3-oxoadipate enol-lactonase [Burkholderiales bacterium]
MDTTVNGLKINYEVTGEGPWLTLSHSLACDLHMWDEQMDALTKSYKVLRYDTRGHGKSAAPAGAYTLEQLADDAYGMLNALGIKRTHWAGLSMGGMIGQTFALKYPGVFQSMVLADTTSRYPAEAAPVWADRIKTAETKGMEAIVDGTLARWFTAPYLATNPPGVARVRASIRATTVAGFAGCCHAIPQINLTHRLKEIACPTLVIVGEQDPGTPVAMAREIHEATPGSQLVIIPSAAHLSNIEQAQPFTDAMLKFLKQH